MSEWSKVTPTKLCNYFWRRSRRHKVEICRLVKVSGQLFASFLTADAECEIAFMDGTLGGEWQAIPQPTKEQ